MSKIDTPIAWKHVGPGWFPGVPKRDLTQADFDALSPRRQREVEASAAYEAVKSPTKSVEPAKPADAPAKTGGKGES